MASEADRRSVFERIYRRAKTCEDLPWHSADPPRMLTAALAARSRPGTALDLGCGAGSYSIYMAQQGYRVIAVDFMPQAAAITRQRAREAGVDLTVIEADVTAFEHPAPVDLVLDAGCLHGLPDGLRERYRQRLHGWLAPGSDYVLVHFSRRGWWDQWPIGPRRRSRAELEAFLGASLKPMAYESEILRMPLLMGHRAEVGRYWFRRE
jgi:SAM-dependent methyltransferase